MNFQCAVIAIEIVYKAALRLVYHGFAFRESYHFPSPRDQAASRTLDFNQAFSVEHILTQG